METPAMTATTTPLQSKFGPIVADAAGTITVQEASDVLDYSRFRVCELLTTGAGRVLVTDVLALKLKQRPLPRPLAKDAARGELDRQLGFGVVSSVMRMRRSSA
jgi:hypothetical protein